MRSIKKSEEFCLLPTLVVGASPLNLFCKVQPDLVDVHASAAAWLVVSKDQTCVGLNEEQLYERAQVLMSGFRDELSAGKVPVEVRTAASMGSVIPSSLRLRSDLVLAS